MADNKNGQNETANRKVTVEATNVEGIAAALGMELMEERPTEEPTEYPAELHTVLETLADIYEGVRVATEQDSRGRSRKMVRQYADRGDLNSNEVGHILRVLEGHELVVQDGNRWRVAEDDGE